MGDWLLAGVVIGSMIGAYAMGYYDGKSKGVEIGRKAGSRSAFTIFGAGLSGLPIEEVEKIYDKKKGGE